MKVIPSNLKFTFFEGIKKNFVLELKRPLDKQWFINPKYFDNAYMQCNYVTHSLVNPFVCYKIDVYMQEN